jgi:hypothetical protein
VATDYDAPRRGTEDDEVETIEEVRSATATRAAQSPNVDEDENATAESFELPGADLSHVELIVEVQPEQADEFTCTSCFLVRHRTQRDTANVNVCVDCA